MDEQFANTRVLIWDFDGTFYKPNAALWKKVREAEIRTLMTFTGWDEAKAIVEFNAVYKHVEPSATETVARLCKISTYTAARMMEDFYDRREFITRDEQLISLFEKLKSYRHFILANGVRQKIEESLVVLGIPNTIFEHIVTSETVGANKPSEKGFRFIINKTQVPPAEHMMIGDRPTIDLAPARNVGMKTCLVWSDISDEYADITVPNVYDVARIFDK